MERESFRLHPKPARGRALDVACMVPDRVVVLELEVPRDDACLVVQKVDWTGEGSTTHVVFDAHAWPAGGVVIDKASTSYTLHLGESFTEGESMRLLYARPVEA